MYLFDVINFAVMFLDKMSINLLF